MTDYSNIGYSLRYDATFNSETGEWIEFKCSDPECEYCKDRPIDASGIADHFKEIKS